MKFRLVVPAIAFALIIVLTLFNDGNRSTGPLPSDVVPEVEQPDTRLALEIPVHRLSSPDTNNAPIASQRVYLVYPELIQITRIENEVKIPVEAISRLQPMLVAEDPVIRLAALESVAAFEHPESIQALVNALYDSEPMVRITAIEGLAMQKDLSADMHIEPLLFDVDKGVITVAIDALAELESDTAIHALASLLSDQDPVIRYSAVNALGEIDSELAREYLSQF